MNTRQRITARWCVTLAMAVVALAWAAPVRAQETPESASKPTIDIYGFGQADMIVESGQSNPDWYDVARPSRLPAYANQFGENGRSNVSVRQSRFGVRSLLPTSDGDVKAQFEFDMFGVGGDAGKTTIRLRHAYGQWKQVGAGQTNSEFMDVDVFPNSLDYWGPNGMLFFRNVQVFWEPYRSPSGSNARIAVENPGGSGDAGTFADRVELQNVKGRFPAPDVTGHYRYANDKWGYVQLGGVMRYMAWDDLIPNDVYNLAGHAWGWGGSLSAGLKAGKNDLIHLQAVYGEGIENYFNDAPVDVAIKKNFNNPVTPVAGQALPILGVVAFLDHTWTDQWTTSVGYSRVDITNSDGQTPDAFKIGQYGLANVLCAPAKNVMMGGEFQWVQRRNFSDGWVYDDYRVQFSFKYSFSFKVGG